MSNPNPLSRLREVAVVGGGIAGCTIAYELARRGVRVTVLERDGIACAASGRNAGLLINQVEPTVVKIMQTSLETYRRLQTGPIGFELREQDQLLLARDDAQLEVAQRRAQAMVAVGVASDALDSAQLLSEFPQLDASVAGGFVLHGAWALEPALATLAFAQAAREEGAEIVLGSRAAALALRGQRCEGVWTDGGRVGADAVVLANGPWMPQLLKAIPITSGRGWLMRTGQLSYRLPWLIEEMAWPDQDELGRAARAPTLAEVAAGGHDRPVVEAVVLAQQPDGSALVGTSLAPSLLDAVEGVEMPMRLAARALALAPGLRTTAVAAAWCGLRPMTPDGMPMVGATEIDGLYIHGGHGSVGMMAAPATAGWLARAMLNETAGEELRDLEPGRF